MSFYTPSYLFSLVWSESPELQSAHLLQHLCLIQWQHIQVLQHLLNLQHQHVLHCLVLWPTWYLHTLLTLSPMTHCLCLKQPLHQQNRRITLHTCWVFWILRKHSDWMGTGFTTKLNQTGTIVSTFAWLHIVDVFIMVHCQLPPNLTFTSITFYLSRISAL